MNDSRAQFVEVVLAPDARVVGKTVAEVNLPRAAVLVSIRRGRDLLIPRGDTELRSGDVVTALCEREWAKRVPAELGARVVPP